MKPKTRPKRPRARTQTIAFPPAPLLPTHEGVDLGADGLLEVEEIQGELLTPGGRHVDDFIDKNYLKDTYARWVLQYFRLPAALQIDFRPYMEKHRLFCTYRGARYRVTGASRFGDIWLNRHYDREHGYQLRVGVDDCSDWSDAP